MITRQDPLERIRHETEWSQLNDEISICDKRDFFLYEADIRSQYLLIYKRVRL
jgi:hypothetical protein